MYKVLDKDTIKNEILPHLSVAKRGYICQSCLSEVIQCILYKLKTGCQWYMLPVSSFFTAKVLHYKTVYGHFRKWCKKGEWQKVWLDSYRSPLNRFDVTLTSWQAWNYIAFIIILMKKVKKKQKSR